QNLAIMSKIDAFEKSYSGSSDEGTKGIALANINSALADYNRINQTNLRFGRDKNGKVGYIDDQNNLVGTQIGSLRVDPARTQSGARVPTSRPIIVTPDGTSARSRRIQSAIDLIKSGRGTLEQLQAAPNFTQAEKDEILRGINE